MLAGALQGRAEADRSPCRRRKADVLAMGTVPDEKLDRVLPELTTDNSLEKIHGEHTNQLLVLWLSLMVLGSFSLGLV